MAWRIAVILTVLAAVGCGRKVTASDSRALESATLKIGVAAFSSTYAAGISKGSSSGKWGLGQRSKGSPFGRLAVEAELTMGATERSVILCSRHWGGRDFPELEGDALLAKLEATAKQAFLAAKPTIEHCRLEADETSFLWARCRTDADAPFGSTMRIAFTRGHGIVRDTLVGIAQGTGCSELVAKQRAALEAVPHP